MLVRELPGSTPITVTGESLGRLIRKEPLGSGPSWANSAVAPSRRTMGRHGCRLLRIGIHRSDRHIACLRIDPAGAHAALGIGRISHPLLRIETIGIHQAKGQPAA